MAYSDAELRAVEIAERVSSVFSLMATAFIVITFTTSRSFRKPINRIVFYVSFANMATNIPTLISRAGIRAGANSALCQTQGFLIQWFMLADPLFTLAMALNVYLTFFRRYSTEQLRGMDWKYIVFCYGAPFVPALACFFMKDGAGVRVYGPATIWCWISFDWKVLRLPVFYGPIWIAVGITMVIYSYTGFIIWSRRRALHKFSHSGPSRPGLSVKVTRQIVTSHVTSQISESELSSIGPEKDLEGQRGGTGFNRSYRPYTVNIEATGDRPSGYGVGGLARQSRVREPDDVAWSYTRAALSYFVAMLVTWVPSSIYRVYTVAHPEYQPYGLMLTAAMVLPLQGFWNGLVYITVSQTACREYFGAIFDPKVFPIFSRWRTASR